MLAKAAARAPPLKVGLAGRDEAKLRALAARLPGGDAATILGGADVADAAALARVARAGRLLLNCAGPYRFYGEPVFKAAAAAGTDYLDLCGEPEFIERMELECAAAARASGALMACASAFDSVRLCCGGRGGGCKGGRGSRCLENGCLDAEKRRHHY